MRAIVNVSTGPAFVRCQTRLVKALDGLKCRDPRIFWSDALPPGSPPHETYPYAFKIHAIRKAQTLGATQVIWMDSSILPVQSLEPIWRMIEAQGYWLSQNYDRTTDRYCADHALSKLGVTREETKSIPQVVGGAFGLDLNRLIGVAFMSLLETAERAGAFADGPSTYPQYIAHRHDQTAMSVIAWGLGMKLTVPPKFFAEAGWGGQNEETILVCDRCR